MGFHIDQISLTFYYSNAYGPSFGLFEAWLYASVLDGPLLDQVFIICSSFICFSLFYTYYQRFFLSVLLDSFINIATVNVTFCFEIFFKNIIWLLLLGYPNGTVFTLFLPKAIWTIMELNCR